MPLKCHYNGEGSDSVDFLKDSLCVFVFVSKCTFLYNAVGIRQRRRVFNNNCVIDVVLRRCGFVRCNTSLDKRHAAHTQTHSHTHSTDNMYTHTHTHFPRLRIKPK